MEHFVGNAPSWTCPGRRRTWWRPFRQRCNQFGMKPLAGACRGPRKACPACVRASVSRSDWPRYGSLSLRLRQNPVPLRGPWAFAFAPFQAPLRGYPRASVSRSDWTHYGAASLRLGANPAGKARLRFAPRSGPSAPMGLSSRFSFQNVYKVLRHFLLHSPPCYTILNRL